MIHTLLLLLTLATAFAARAQNTAAPTTKTNATWRVGVASAVITPAQPMWMAGYASRTNVSQGKAQDLFVKALALDDGAGGRLVIVTMDLIGVPRSLRKNLETRLLAAHQLRPENFLLNASHTHCGPEFRVGRTPADDGAFGPTQPSASYGAGLEEKVFHVIGAALTNAAPARIGYSHARCGVAMNRRLPSGTNYQNSPYPDGPVDHSVPVLRVEGADGKLRAVLFGYACHNTTLGFYQFCGDYAGFAQQYLEADHPGATALFLTGCGGDQNPYPRGTLDLAQRHGRSLATAVEAALLPKPRVLTGPLRAAFAEIELPYATAPGREEFERRLLSKDKYEVQHATRMLAALKQDGRLPEKYPYPVQVVRFGNELTLVALGGETVVDYSLRLKRELAGPASAAGAACMAVWVSGYSNDVMAYIPSERVLREGGYEGGGAMRFSTTHPGPWAAGVEERIVGQVREMERGLRREP